MVRAKRAARLGAAGAAITTKATATTTTTGVHLLAVLLPLLLLLLAALATPPAAWAQAPDDGATDVDDAATDTNTDTTNPDTSSTDTSSADTNQTAMRYDEGPCVQYWGRHAEGSLAECESDKVRGYPNVPILTSVYCYNNGTGICKALAGRFEFWFNTFEDRILGPMFSMQNVGLIKEYGWHVRLPSAYNPRGDTVYADRAIRWAHFYVGGQPVKHNLLSSQSFNWCLFVQKDNWPYRSSIRDPHTNGQYQIFFYNRQSCIYDTKTKKATHYNTRFVHNSRIKIDHDMNPLIFVMEDNRVAPGTDRFRLVKNKRQHWYASTYRVIDHPKRPGFNFLKVNNVQQTPCTIDGTRHLFTPKMLRDWSKSSLCITDRHTKRQGSEYNSPPLNKWCGFDEVEIADLPRPQYRLGRPSNRVYECELHNLADGVPEAENFLGVKYSSEVDWNTVKDGMAFSAWTTIPDPSRDDTVRVLMLWARYQGEIKDEYDEHYPLPHISDYKARFYPGSGQWIYNRTAGSRPMKNLNYVDDIAYLPQCGTILTIFGPLYTEILPDEFGRKGVETLMGSVDELGFWEMTNAFFANYAEKYMFYAYHRTNFVGAYRYSCGSNDGQSRLVKAAKIETYRSRHGTDMWPAFEWHTDYLDRRQPARVWDFQEEKYFHDVGVLNYSYWYARDPPNPFDYEYHIDPRVGPGDEASNLWLYLLVALGVLTILTMGIICLVTLRRRHRRRKEELLAQSTLDPLYTARSGGLSSAHSGASSMPTNRSGMSSRPMSLGGASTATQRSTTLPSATSTNRSGIPTSHGGSTSAANGGSHRASHGPSQRATASQRSGAPVPFDGIRESSKSRSRSSSRRRGY